MTLKLQNSLTGKQEEFTPIQAGKVSIYTCGPTVYDYLHVGNWSAYIYWDILVRTLAANGYQVERVMNITDVGHLVSDADEGEDKLEKGARREGKTAWDIAKFYTDDFLQGMQQLKLNPPEHLVKATDYIPQQLNLIRTLKIKGYTYQTSDGIYFDTAKFKTYADFAHLDLTAQQAGARVSINSEKKQPWDFALWKFSLIGQKRDMEWETPSDLLDRPLSQAETVMGFPGWHLECSAMAMAILGPTIDIHTGGIDHIPVHHTNEIAQSEAASDQQFAHYWLHNNHLKIAGGKVSKSEGNGYTLQDLAKRGFLPMDLKMFVLQGQFMNEGNFTWDNLAAARSRRLNWLNYAALRHQLNRLPATDSARSQQVSLSLKKASHSVVDALNDSLNTPLALSIVDQVFSDFDKLDDLANITDGLTDFINTIDQLLGLSLIASSLDITDEQKQLIKQREQARQQQDWRLSDELRDQLLSQGVAVRDSSVGTIWTYAQ